MRHTNTNFLFSLFPQRALSNFIFAGALLFVLFLCLSTVSTAQNEPLPKKKNPPVVKSGTDSEKAKSTIRGKAVYDDTGRPIRRAGVMLLSEEGNLQGKTGTTDKDGNFEIKDVTEGTYYITVTTPGVITPFGFSGNIFNPSTTRQKDSNVIKALKDFFTAVNVDGTSDTKVEVRAKRGGAINGKITYSDGDPAINVSVEVLQKKDGKFSSVTLTINLSAILGTKTDDRGVYRIAGLPPGEYVVRASEPVTHQENKDKIGEAMEAAGNMFGNSSSMLVTFYPEAAKAESATAINITAGQEQNDINISLPDRNLYKISGTVIARRDKSPVQRANVSIKAKEAQAEKVNPLEFFNQSYTDEKGNWSFKELPDGVYIITINTKGINIFNPDPTPDKTNKPKISQFSKQQKEVKISGGNVTDVIIELSDGASISGKVSLTNAKTPDGRMILVQAESLEKPEEKDESVFDQILNNERGRVDEKGNFSIQSLPAGPTYLNVELMGSAYYVKNIKVGTVDLTYLPLNLTEGADVKDVQIILGDDPSTLRGSVRITDDKPVYGVGVLLIPTNPIKWRTKASFKNYRYTVTDTKGDFFIHGVAPDEYFVIITNTQTDLNNINPDWIKASATNARKVLLKPNDNQIINLTLPPAQ